MHRSGRAREAVVGRIRSAERNIAWIRLVVTLSGVALYPRMASALSNLALGRFVLFASLAYSVIAIVLTRRADYGALRLSFVTVVMDVGLALTSVALTGGPRSPVMPAIFLLAFSFAFRYPPAPTLVGGVLATAGYMAAMSATFGFSTHVSAHGSYLMVTTLLATLMSRDAFGERLGRHAAEELAEANERATKVRLELAHETAARAAAEAAVQAREEFLSVAAHELKTPLTAMMLEMELLNRGAKQKGSSSSLPLERLKRTTQRIANLVEKLLDISRMVGGRLELQREPADLGAMVKESCAKCEEVLERAGCTLTVSVEAGIWTEIDRTRVEQIVENLLSNAAKYAKGTPVEVRVSRDRGGVVMQVADHGIGIAPEDQERIFERFQRAASSRHYGGLGLGLWIVRQFVEQMGGTVKVESRLAEGSTFEVWLPLDEQGSKVSLGPDQRSSSN
jgi:signal transduction histidine kinase